MRIVILGCGRTGAALARIMAAEGHKVTLIEWNSDSLERLGGKFSGAVIPGNGLDEDILKKAGIEQADLFAALTEGDNRNLMAAQIAKERFRVPKVVAKVNDPIRAQAYRERGIYTICYGLIGSSIIRDLAYDRPLGSVEEYNVLPPELED
ncbi:MAG: TrkA family potassium uptake protein [Firmicutes bacterium]|nr:TrkA family potassium uptake protein [Bacillota bacterium]